MVWTIIGIVLGVLAAFPSLYVLAISSQRHQPFNFGVVLATAIVPFICLMLILLAVNMLAHDIAVGLSMAASFAFLGTMVLGILLIRPWR